MEACVAEIKKNGWAIAIQESNQPEARPPTAAYTIGLYEQFGHPELLVFGLTVPTMRGVLTRMAEAIKRTGGSFQAGEFYPDVIKKREVLLRAVAAHEIYKEMGIAQVYYGRRHYTALQIVWPDATGRFPWETGFAVEHRRRQPLLTVNS